MKNIKLSEVEYEAVKQESTLTIWYLLCIVDYMKEEGNMDIIKMYLNKIVNSSFLEMKELINKREYTIQSNIIELAIKGLCCVSITLAGYGQYGTLKSLEILISQLSKATYQDLERYEKILLKALK